MCGLCRQNARHQISSDQAVQELASQQVAALDSLLVMPMPMDLD